MPRLILRTGDKAGMEFGVTSGMIIGRRLEIPVHLNDEKASREHARIDQTADGWMLVDLKSTNGTFVSGSRITSTRLNHGDVIRIGRTEILFHDPSSAPATPPPAPAAAAPPPPAPPPPQKKVNIAAPPTKKISGPLTPTKRRSDRFRRK